MGTVSSKLTVVFHFLQGRKRAEDLSECINVWSGFLSLTILIVMIGQVIVLKSFFSEKKPSQLYGYH